MNNATTFYQTSYMPYGAGPDSAYQFAGILTMPDGTKISVLTNGCDYIRDGVDYDKIAIDGYVDFLGAD